MTVRKMTRSQVAANRRISDIDDELRELRRHYETVARHSETHTRIWMRMSDLQSELEMLRAIVTFGPIRPI